MTASSTTMTTTSRLLVQSCSLILGLIITRSPCLASVANESICCLKKLCQTLAEDETRNYVNLVPGCSKVNVDQLAIDLQQLALDISEERNGTRSDGGLREQHDDRQIIRTSTHVTTISKKKRSKPIVSPEIEGAVKKPKTTPQESRKVERNTCEGNCSHAQDVLEVLEKKKNDIRKTLQHTSFEDEVKQIIQVDTDAIIAMIRPYKTPPKIAYGLASLYLHEDCTHWVREVKGRSKQAYSRTWGAENKEYVRASVKMGYKMALLEHTTPGTGILPVHAKDKFHRLHLDELLCLQRRIEKDAGLSSLAKLYSNKNAKRIFMEWAIGKRTAKSKEFQRRSEGLLEHSIKVGYQRIIGFLDGRDESSVRLPAEPSSRTSADIAPGDIERIDPATSGIHTHRSNSPCLEIIIPHQAVTVVDLSQGEDPVGRTQVTLRRNEGYSTVMTPGGHLNDSTPATNDLLSGRSPPPEDRNIVRNSVQDEDHSSSYSSSGARVFSHMPPTIPMQDEVANIDECGHEHWDDSRWASEFDAFSNTGLPFLEEDLQLRTSPFLGGDLQMGGLRFLEIDQDASSTTLSIPA